MKFILGTKVGMTQVFDESGRVFPATVISAGPNSVTQVKTEETDGYNAVQVAFKDQKEHRMNKPLMGHFNKAGVTPKSELREFRTEGAPEQKVGDVIDASTFEVGDNITVRGISKGKGFQGVVSDTASMVDHERTDRSTQSVLLVLLEEEQEMEVVWLEERRCLDEWDLT